MTPLSLAALVLALPAAPQGPDPALLGRWGGGFGDLDPQEGHWTSLTVSLVLDEGGTLGVEIGARTPGPEGFQATVEAQGTQLEVGLTLASGRVSLRGAVEDGLWRGRSVAAGVEGEFVLLNERPDDEARTSACAGVYRAHDAGFLIQKSLHLLLTDLEQGTRRVLYAVGEDRYVAGPAFSRPAPTTLTVEFERDAGGEPRALTVRTEGQPARRAARVPSGPTEPFAFESDAGEGGAVRIAGDLSLPAGDAPHPAVIMVHGSGRATRSGAGHWVPYLVSRGFAVLAVDKRGVGASGGTYEMPDGGHDNLPHMRRRAGDVRAALAALAADPRIDGERIGLAGGSQAGWVIPMAAAQGDVFFTLILSGGATALSYEGIFSRVADEDGAGRGAISIEAALEQTRNHTALDPNFDEYFAAMQAPGLWLYGDKDRSNPTQLCVELIERIAAEHGRDFRIQRFPHGNHGLTWCRYGGATEAGAQDRNVEGLFEAIDTWLQEKQLLR